MRHPSDAERPGCHRNIHGHEGSGDDTGLLPAGSTTGILLELSNPGRWMVPRHIAEHPEAGMTFVFEVEETP